MAVARLAKVGGSCTTTKERRHQFSLVAGHSGPGWDAELIAGNMGDQDQIRRRQTLESFGAADNCNRRAPWLDRQVRGGLGLESRESRESGKWSRPSIQGQIRTERPVWRVLSALTAYNGLGVADRTTTCSGLNGRCDATKAAVATLLVMAPLPRSELFHMTHSDVVMFTRMDPFAFSGKDALFSVF